MLPYDLAHEESEPTTTAGTAIASSLVTGTVLQVAGAAVDVTAPCVHWTSLSFLRPEEAHLPVKTRIEPVAYPRAKKSKKKRMEASQSEAGAFVPGIFEVHEGWILQEKIKRFPTREKNSGVQLVGRKGTSLLPSKKYYDLDLDEYQLD